MEVVQDTADISNETMKAVQDTDATTFVILALEQALAEIQEDCPRFSVCEPSNIC